MPIAIHCAVASVPIIPGVGTEHLDPEAAKRVGNEVEPDAVTLAEAIAEALEENGKEGKRRQIPQCLIEERWGGKPLAANQSSVSWLKGCR